MVLVFFNSNILKKTKLITQKSRITKHFINKPGYPEINKNQSNLNNDATTISKIV